jgi:hypothetical protein
VEERAEGVGDWVAKEKAKFFQVVYCWSRASDDLGFFDGHFVRILWCVADFDCVVTTKENFNPIITYCRQEFVVVRERTPMFERRLTRWI